MTRKRKTTDLDAKQKSQFWRHPIISSIFKKLLKIKAPKQNKTGMIINIHQIMPTNFVLAH